MKFVKGLYTDCAEQDMPPGTYRFAKNMVDSNLQQALENEDGFKNLGSVVTEPIIGIVPVQDDFVVFSTDNTTHKITLVTVNGESLTPTLVYSNSALNFNTNSPIKGEFRKDIFGNRTVAWVDNINVPRIINIDEPGDINSIEDLSIFQNVNNPAITNAVINDTGGSLPTGALIIITKYENEDGTTTNWFVHDKVFYINDDRKSQAFEQYDGAVGGLNSGKSITVDLTGCDTRYSKIVIGYIHSSNGVLSANKSITRAISSTINLTLTGSESKQDITLDEVLTPSASYVNAKTITQLAGRLYLANLTSEELPNLQSVALNSRINYTSELKTVTVNTGNHRDVEPPTFTPGEVYAFYLGVELLKGGWVYYHIPGRAPTTTGYDDRGSITSNGLTYKRFQVEDTVNKSGAATKMGYWENENELYPNTEPFITAGLNNQPVRHHRFPTLNSLKNNEYNATANVGITSLPVLSIEVSNVVIPTELQSKISRWGIFYAKKTPQNSLVVGSDLYQYSGEKAGVYYNMGGNFIQAWLTSGGLDQINYTINRSKGRGHSLDLLLNKSLRPTYARFDYNLNKVNTFNNQYVGFRSSGGIIAKTNDDPEDSKDATAAVLDYTTVFGSSSTITNNPSTAFTRLNDFQYIPENSVLGNFDNLNSEGIFAYTLNDLPANITAIDSIGAKMITARVNRFSPEKVFITGTNTTLAAASLLSTSYMTYYNLLTNVHNSFYDQELVQTNSVSSSTTAYQLPSSTSGLFKGGDSFLSYISYLSSTCNLFGVDASFPNNIPDNDGASGVRVWHSYIGYTKSNINYRQELPGDLSTLYHGGKTDVRTLFSPVATNADGETTIPRANVIFNSDPQNTVQYNPDFSLLNTFSVGTIFNVENRQATEAPNTIIYSAPQNEEIEEASWRSFLAGDRYTMNRNRGDITNIQGFRNRELIIHTEDSIFRTRTDVNAGAVGENIFFRSADLFELPPEELQPTLEGYGGTQHMFSCVLTKYGYVYVNNKQGKVFIYTGESLDEVSSNGMRNFFRDFMQDTSTNNPFTSNGYTVGFDEKYNRIIVSKKNTTLPWTLSYNPLKKVWVSYHDYQPSYMFTTPNNKLFSLNNNALYLNNALSLGIVKGRFYNENPFPSYVDLIFNPEPDRTKQFVNVEWVTESYPINSDAVDYNSTFTDLTAWTKEHCTGKLTLTQGQYNSLYNSNLRNLGRTWHFNDLRDISVSSGARLPFSNNFDVDQTKLDTNMSWYDRRKINEKYLICRLEYNNLLNNRILLLDSIVNYRYAR